VVEVLEIILARMDSIDSFNQVIPVMVLLEQVVVVVDLVIMAGFLTVPVAVVDQA
jgi:hypothetical protein